MFNKTYKINEESKLFYTEDQSVSFLSIIEERRRGQVLVAPICSTGLDYSLQFYAELDELELV